MRPVRHLAAIGLVLAAITALSARTSEAASTWQTVIRAGHPVGLAIDSRGRPQGTKWSYTVDDYRNVVVKFGTGGAILKTWPYSGPALYKLGADVAVGGSGNVFVADANTNLVSKFDPFGRKLGQFSGFDRPRGVAVDRAGNIYVAEQGAWRVTKLSPTGRVLARWDTPWANGAGKSAPFGIAVAGNGSIFVAVKCDDTGCTADDHGDRPEAILQLNASGVMQSNLLGGTPHGGWAKEEQPFVVLNNITVDRQGNLYVAGLLHGGYGTLVQGVLVYGAGSYQTARYTLPGIPGPTGVAVDPQKKIYVAQDGRILKLSRGG